MALIHAVLPTLGFRRYMEYSFLWFPVIFVALRSELIRNNYLLTDRTLQLRLQR